MLNIIAKNMLVSLATGVSFTFGVVLVMIAYQIYDETWQVDENTWIDSPETLSISTHELVPEQHQFTVRGTIDNVGTETWETVHVEINIFAGTALMNSCDESVSEVVPGSARRFKIDCYKVSGKDLPSNVSYTIGIRSGFRVN